MLCLLGIIKHSFVNIIQCPNSEKKTTDHEKWFKCLQKLNAFSVLADCVGLGAGFVQNIGVLQPVLQLLLPSVCTRCTRSAFLTFENVRTRLSEAENQSNIRISLRIHITSGNYKCNIYSPTVRSMFFRAENPLIKNKSSIQRPMLNVSTSLISFE